MRPNDLLPCGTDSARRRHIMRAEDCSTCGVEGGVPESVWRKRVTPGFYDPAKLLLCIDEIEGRALRDVEEDA